MHSNQIQNNDAELFIVFRFFQFIFITFSKWEFCTTLIFINNVKRINVTFLNRNFSILILCSLRGMYLIQFNRIRFINKIQNRDFENKKKKQNNKIIKYWYVIMMKNRIIFYAIFWFPKQKFEMKKVQNTHLLTFLFTFENETIENLKK